MKMLPLWLCALFHLTWSACSANAATVAPVFTNDTVANTLSFNDTFGHNVVIGSYNSSTGAWTAIAGTATFTGNVNVTNQVADGSSLFSATGFGFPPLNSGFFTSGSNFMAMRYIATYYAQTALYATTTRDQTKGETGFYLTFNDITGYQNPAGATTGQKAAFQISASGGSGGGEVWDTAESLQLLSGWHGASGNFAVVHEIDPTNNDIDAIPGNNTTITALWLAGNIGTQPISSYLAIQPSAINGSVFAAHDGIRFTGATTVKDNLIWGNTASTNGINLAGATFTTNAFSSPGASISGSGSLIISGGTGAQPTLQATNTGTATLYSTPGFLFTESEAYASYGATNTHFGLAVQATKSVSGSTSTGSRQAATLQQLGVGGTSADFFTAGFELTEPCLAPVTCNAFNLSGNFTGNNPYVYIPAAMTPTTVVGEEVDNTNLSAGATEREGVRIVDINSTQSGTIDAAINVVNSAGLGWKTGLYWGDTTGTFGLAAGGTFLDTPAVSAVTLNTFMNFANITAAPTLAAILLPQNSSAAGIGFGTHGACCSGGALSSQTAAGGPQIVFANGFLAIQVPTGTNTLLIGSKGEITQTPQTIANVLAVTCNSAIEGSRMYIKDSVGASAPSFHLIVAGAGVQNIDSPAYCDGANWRYE